MLNNNFFCNRQSKSRATRIGRTSIVQPIELFKIWQPSLSFGMLPVFLNSIEHHIPGEARGNVNDAVYPHCMQRRFFKMLLKTLASLVRVAGHGQILGGVNNRLFFHVRKAWRIKFIGHLHHIYYRSMCVLLALSFVGYTV